MRQEFDFIVVGGGSAGCALAARLSEEPAAEVLLVEAGPDSRSWKIRMPLAVDSLLTTETFNWNFHSEAEPGLGGRRIAHPRGRVLGGSSAINGMVYTRGNPQDYDEWRDRFSCEGWGYADILPYFKRLETAPPGGDDRYRGRSGPLEVTRPGAGNALNQAFLEAGRALGYPTSDDANGAQHEGFAVAEQTIIRGQRNTSAAAYLTASVRARPNLTILAGGLVERILFEGRRASAVRCRRPDGIADLRARREIILCAGGVGSAHILQLSGVGDAEDLRRHGIEVVLDLKGVGANLQDHPDIAVQYACLEPVSLRRHTRLANRVPVGVNWFLFKRGIAASNQFEVSAYLRTRAGLSKPNVKFEFFPLAISHENYKPYTVESFQIHCTLETSHARGTLTLRSAEPTERPVLRFNYLSDERDLQDIRDGIAMIREIVASRPFDRYRGGEIEPGEAVRSPAALDNWIRSRATTAYHVAGTCRMGRANDPAAVVAPDLKVIGLQGLRVADASIMPVIVTSNLNATSIMIGDRAGDLCLGKPPLAASNDAYWVHPSWQTSQR